MKRHIVYVFLALAAALAVAVACTGGPEEPASQEPVLLRADTAVSDEPCKTGKYWRGDEYDGVVAIGEGKFAVFEFGYVVDTEAWEAFAVNSDGTDTYIDARVTLWEARKLVEDTASEGKWKQNVGRWTNVPCPLGVENE